MKRKDLEICLQRVEPFHRPKPEREQYITPAPIAADLLFLAYASGHIQGHKVADLGCGTGMLGIGAALLGAEMVLCVDVDQEALDQCAENALTLGVELELRLMEVTSFSEHVDTVVMNPPFGAQNRHADRPFLLTAMSCASVIYSLHLSETVDFLARFAASKGFNIDLQKSFKLDIPHTFAFHRKEKKSFEVSLLRFCKFGDLS